jgi:iron complex outermembrane receptor protein
MKNLCVSISVIIGIFISNGQEKVIDSLQVEKLEEVLVRSVRVAADSPISHSNLDKEQLEERNLGQDIPYMLSFLPSVVTTSDAGAGIGYTYIRVRGSDASRVNVTLNGIPFNDAESQGSFFVNLPDFTSSVQSLQLQRGVGTSTNGSGAFGASLNILTDAVSEIPGGEISNSFGSYNSRKHTLKFSTGLLKDHIEIAGRLSKIESDGYIDRASSDLKSYFLQAAFVSENTLLKVLGFGGKEITYQAWNGIDGATLETDRTFNPSGMYTDEEGNVKFYDNEVDNYSQDHYQLLWNERYSSNWSSNLALNYTYGRGYFEQYKEDQKFEDYDFVPIEIAGDTINSTDLVRRRWLNNNFYAVNADINYKNEQVDASLGTFYSYYGGDHFGEVIWAQNAGGSDIRERYYSGNGDKNEFTIFTKATYRFNNRWSAFVDLQGRFISYRSSGLTSERTPLAVDEKYQFFNPKAGLSYKMDKKNQFYFSYGKANREPRRSDFEQGIFTAEKLDDFESGWRTSLGESKLNINLFYMDYRDQLVLTGAIDDVGAAVRATSGKSYRAGVEIDADIVLSDKLRFRPNMTLSSNKNRNFIASIDGELVDLGNTNISFSPEIIAGSSISYFPLNNFQIALLTKYVGSQFMGNLDSEVSKLDSYFINDFNLQYTLDNIPWIRSVVLTGMVNNIFNRKYVSNGYYYTFDDNYSVPGEITTIEGAGYYPQAEVNFLVGATLKL